MIQSIHNKQAIAAAPAVDEELIALTPPGILRELGQGVPLTALQTLVDQFGGTRIFVPKAARLSSPLRRALGKDVLEALCALRGGESICIPMAAAWRRAIRDRQILAALSSGATRRQVARQFHMHERNVYAIARRARSRLARRSKNLKPN